LIFIVGHARTGTSVLFKCMENSFCVGDNLFGHKYETQDLTLNWYRRQVYDKVAVDFNDFWEYADRAGIELLKDPELWMVFGALFHTNERFANSRFIWTIRPSKDVAMSAVRLQRMRNMPPCPPNPKKTIVGQIESYEKYCTVLESYYHKTDSHLVDFEQLLESPDKVGKRLSEFVGRKVDMSLVDTQETYKATGVPQ